MAGVRCFTRDAAPRRFFFDGSAWRPRSSMANSVRGSQVTSGKYGWLMLNQIQLTSGTETHFELSMGISLIPIITNRRGIKRVKELWRLQVSLSISYNGGHDVKLQLCMTDNSSRPFFIYWRTILFPRGRYVVSCAQLRSILCEETPRWRDEVTWP